jgi:hypothetical protein
MSLIRFTTAQALFEAFPEVSQRIATAPSEQVPIDFVKRLWSEGKIAETVTFCAYLLPRREAVWWACGCARRLLGDIPKDQAAGLRAAEAWVRRPDDEHRQAALDIGLRGDRKDAQTWLALAAGRSGGFLKSNQNPPALDPSVVADLLRKINPQSRVTLDMIARARQARLSGQSKQNPQIPVPPAMTARAARIAVLFSVSKAPGIERTERLEICIAEAIELAENGLQVRPRPSD